MVPLWPFIWPLWHCCLSLATLLFNWLYMLWAFWWWCKRVAAEALIQGVINVNNDLLCSQKRFIKRSNKLNILTFWSALFLDTDICLTLFLYFLQKFIVNCFDNVNVRLRGVTIHIPCDLIWFWLLPSDFDYFDSIMQLFLNSYDITRNVNNMQPLTLYLRTVTGTGGFTVAWSFIAMFENLTKSVSYMVCLTWKSQGVVEGQHFYQATQNGARAAIVFARQSKMHILKSSGFWFYNVITHWGHPGKDV